MDFQKTLLRLRDRLRDEHHYPTPELVGNTHICHSTAPITQFLIWLESNKEAQEILKDLEFNRR
jgi:hypothetical protein